MLKKTIALTGGSTGGHIFPLLSIYNYFTETDKYNFIWFGEKGSLEESISKQFNIKFHYISVGKIRRYFDFKNFYDPFKNLTGILESIYFIRKYKIDIVFSKGGYVSLPMAIGAKIMNKKLFIHESDIVCGLSNRIVSKISDKVFYSFENDYIDNINHIFSGQILNPSLLDSIEDLEIKEDANQKVVVIAGSQGSTIILKSLLSILSDLSFIDFDIILGEKNLSFRKSFLNFKNVVVHDFVSQKDLGVILKNADIAITRGGATSLYEQNVFGIHSIIIPLIGSAGDHQVKNAIYFNEKFDSDIIYEDQDISKTLKDKLILYKDLKKAGFNLDRFYEPLNIIKNNLS